ncbi:cytochrome c oxidase accessory protein CcoG [Deltaproteobacteria bacterium TL4]
MSNLEEENITTPEIRPSSIDAKGYRNWIYPQELKGWFYQHRQWVGYGLILFYLVMPWIHFHGMPAIQLNVEDRQFILFGQIYWPQDVKYLMFVLAIASIALFFFTALAGRLWCGWACPQTIFMEFVFRPIEKLLEGPRNQRIALDRAPWTWNKIWRKGVKHLIFLFISAIIANTFLAYFVGMDEVLAWMRHSPKENEGEFIFMFVNLAIFYFDFSWFREQFCIIACPYARFQSALVDEQTFQVTYDPKRGEPRGHLGKVKGDCIDCGACVRVCPTGIDIRNGTQMECIGCARCIDACDQMMEKVKRPKGLVRYDSLARMSAESSSLVRPRTIIYAVLLLSLILSFFWVLAHRSLVEFTVIRPPGDPYTILPDGKVSNHFVLRLINKDLTDHTVDVHLDDDTEGELIVPFRPFHIKANSDAHLDLFVNIPQGKLLRGKYPAHLIINDSFQVKETIVQVIGPQ